ncbi:MAG: flagellar biosynthesis protein FlhF [Eubacteriales bacterium]|nr:flagellar biosynthesis protein FlhF [Eubacteriales bacterium]
MIVKKFQAPTEKEAIIKANEELGSNAVVLNVKTLKQRGIFKFFKKDMVEVTAALEEKDFVEGINNRKPTFEKKKTPVKQENKTENAGMSSINLVADEKLDTNSSAAIEQKLDSLHSLLQNQMVMPKNSSDSKEKYNKDSENKKKEDNSTTEGEKVAKERENANYKFLQLIYKKLVDNEVDEKYADEIIGDIEKSLKKESNIDSILAAVYQKIILKLGQPKVIKFSEKPKVIFFIGPTGVGKTTTIAKIASRFKLEKHAKVAFITSDTYRIAAVEQLNTYASIIDCPVNVVYSADEMDECLDEYKNYDLILVDTAGRSHKSEEQMEELKELIEHVKKRDSDFEYEIYLTLSITTKYKDLINITEKYKEINGWSIIFTKLDETCSLGNILNIRLLTGTDLSYTTSGQNVPNDIEVINEQGIAKQLLGGNN